MPIKFHFDPNNLTKALHELALLTGKDYADIVKHEAGKSLEGAIRRTDAANDALIATIKSPVRRRAAELAKGLAKKKWAQLAEKWHVHVENLPDYAQRAIGYKVINGGSELGFGSDYPEDAHGYTSTSESAGRSFVMHADMRNLYWPGMSAAINSGMRGRRDYLRMNLRKGVFDKAEEIAKKYPGLYVNRTL